MAITPAPGWMIDPNNPNGVIPISSYVPPNAIVPQAPAPTPPPQQYNPPPQTQAPAPTPLQQMSISMANAPQTVQPPTVQLQKGSTDVANVTLLQNWLATQINPQTGQPFLTQQQIQTGPGIFGPQTEAAVTAWQAANGVDNSTGPGVYGPRTIAAAQAKATGSTNSGGGSVSGSPISPTNPKDTSTGSTGSVPGLPDGVNNALNSIPPDTFTTLTPQLTPGTPEYQQAMDNIDTSYYDILQQQMTATTQQEKQVAEYNWNQLHDYIQNNLGITLSNDAIQGWDQLQQTKNQYGGLNLENSGLQNESVDQYLKKVRQSDSGARYQAKTRQDEAQQAYYANYATPDQVKQFAAANPAKAKQWGLIPGDDIKGALTPAALKAKYPHMSDADIQKTIAATLDENGNYRSALYQKYMTGSNNGIDAGGNIDQSQVSYDQYGNITGYGAIKPVDTGILDIQGTKATDQRMNVEAASAAKALGTAAANKDSTASSIAAGPSSNTTNQYLQSTSPTNPPASSPAPTPAGTATPSNPFPQPSPQPPTPTPPAATAGAPATPPAPATPKVLTPAQISKYYSTEGTKANPMSPTAWLATQPQ